ncbi:hypothetical protein ACO0RG_001129 [Hanseniaspora osmophila]|uniref:Protein NSG2 n=1 Tax=Hanseniaspora osmophila TaxID=56408 RepID=A0A1E5RNM2_9ASCO|nr:Protein NSG2 [Hanseniaspora osmophila]
MTQAEKDPITSKSYSNLITPQLYGLYANANDTIVEEEADRYMALVDSFLSAKGHDPTTYIKDMNTKNSGKSVSAEKKLPSVDEMESFLKTHNAKTGASVKASKNGQFCLYKIVKSTIVFAVVGVVYSKIINMFYDHHLLIHPAVVYVLEPFLNASLGKAAGLGVVLGGVLYVFDKILLQAVFTTDKDRVESVSTLIKLGYSLIGMFLGLRKIEWKSGKEASLMWFCLNLMIWLMFDFTKSLLVIGIAMGGVLGVMNSSLESIGGDSIIGELSSTSLFLFNVNFVFSTIMFFGKLARYLRQ